MQTRPCLISASCSHFTLRNVEMFSGSNPTYPGMEELIPAGASMNGTEALFSITIRPLLVEVDVRWLTAAGARPTSAGVKALTKAEVFMLTVYETKDWKETGLLGIKERRVTDKIYDPHEINAIAI